MAQTQTSSQQARPAPEPIELDTLPIEQVQLARPQDAEFTLLVPHEVIDHPPRPLTWSDVRAVTLYLVKLIAIVALVGSAGCIAWWFVFELVPALLSGASALISTAFSALVAGAAVIFALLGKILAAVAGGVAIVWLLSGFFSRPGQARQPAPGQPTQTANYTRSAVNNATRTSVINIVNNIKVDQ